ncbi:putative membrane protein YfcA [Dongia mobilis]|uniref:Probable membrane transporter protein n=1 Tax=Dongia mobilis TaxID=578943 RepID=A0A4R6WNU4_9PROT|nr:sulfite exporter TauE/SafE family protein [Dongia mobilis]TDQ80640.1 putative membrane protein YfcA [Dongia mobilis]
MFDYDILLLAGMLALAGCFSGFLAGLLGVGGGIVVVPVLFHVLGAFDVQFDLRMHIAIGTSLGSIVPTSIISLRSHHRRGAVDWGLLKQWAPWIAVGVVIGSVLASIAKGATLTLIFAVMALVIASYLAFARSDYHLAKSLPVAPWRQAICIAIGGFSAMMGIGGGSFTVPTLTLCSYPIRRAVGTASAVGLIIAVPGAISFVVTGWGLAGLPETSLGYVNMLAVAMLVPGSLICAPLGARVAHTVPGGILRKFFALFLLATSMRMFYSLA